MIEIVRQTTGSDMLQHLVPYLLLALVFLGIMLGALYLKTDKLKPEVRVCISVLSILALLGTIILGVVNQPQYQVVKDDYYTTSTQTEGNHAIVARRNSDNSDLLLRVTDGSSQQVRKTVNLMDADDETLLVTWNDAGPHSLSVSPKKIRYVKRSEEAKVKQALSNIMDAVTTEADTLFPGSKTSHSEDEFVDDPTDASVSPTTHTNSRQRIVRKHWPVMGKVGEKGLGAISEHALSHLRLKLRAAKTLTEFFMRHSSVLLDAVSPM